MAAIVDILELEQLERNMFRGSVHPTELVRTYGGQVAGQALVSAVRTVDDGYSVHSLHGYFLRPGNPTIPTVYLVDRIRDGRSFVTRRVTGVQNGEAIFTMAASFHIDGDEGIEHQDQMPKVPSAADLEADAQIAETVAERELTREWGSWDLRIVPAEQAAKVDGLAAQQRVWIRYRDRLPDVPILHICALAYLSDMTLIGSARVPHPGVVTQNASLDHAMWFMRPFRADEWLLYDQSSPSAGFGRALTQGRMFDTDGNMVAAVVQEGLQRIMKTAP
ncbi:MAG: acyl-CoA thioesterase II [Rhodococcus sp.]|nr:acyl-CoA thioesterase II [Rhodococcus sp. (in: high G+C Gram-positive bacteria)]